MKHGHALVGSCLASFLALAPTGCHVIFGLDDFTEATADDDELSSDAGPVGNDSGVGPAGVGDDDELASGGNGAPDDDVAGVDAGWAQGGSADGGVGGELASGGTGGSSTSGGAGGDAAGGTNNAAGAANGGAAGSAGAPAVGGGGASSTPPDAGSGGAEGDPCAACPSATPICLNDACVVCSPGTSECDDDGPRQCDPSGTWLDLGPCREGVCFEGRCVPPSCDGLPTNCGPLGDRDCCSSLPVAGGSFQRQRDLEPTVTLSDFRLDEFEVTVGRFRRFLEARDTWTPVAGMGAYPRALGGGWDPAWPLGSASQIVAGLAGCDLSSYTDTEGANENLPIGCLDWYEAFAFCAWDGGHLQTDAQWSYAAMGGAEQRHYPWSVPGTSTAIDESRANYSCALPLFSAECLRDVGSFPAGNGRFGHADLAGNTLEWVMDAYESASYFDCGPSQVNCLSQTGSERGVRGGSYKGGVQNSAYTGESPSSRLTFFRADAPGARCARAALDAATESCNPGDAGCSGDTRRLCDASGQWVSLETCADGCDAGTCNECSAPDVGCVDNQPTTCGAGGSWVPGAPCSGATPVCRAGACVAVCSGLATCGVSGDQDCCEALPVPGGAFHRLNDDTLPATVSPFSLERFEVTVGRFREFVDAYPDSRPAAGAGAHPLIAASGWDPAWDAALPATRGELEAELTSCFRNIGNTASTYTKTASTNETLAVNCVSWYEAFAFCAFAGGRLPTFAEHAFAFVGGPEQRFYPWSELPGAAPLDLSFANHDELRCPSQTIDLSPCIAPVGSSPSGAGAFGHEDLAGNLAEFTLDLSAWPLTVPCDDCVQAATGMTSRRMNGASWLDAPYQLQGDFDYGSAAPGDRGVAGGFRCVQP